MLEERVMYLINAEIDGALEELRKLASLLEQMPDQEPPADLSRRVLAELPAPAPQRPFSLAGWFASIQPAPTAAAFAAGLLVAIGAYELSSPDRPRSDIANMVGTIVTPRSGAEAVNRDRVELSAAGVSGTLALDRQGDVYVLRVDLQSSRQTEILIQLAEAGLGFGGLAHAIEGVRDEESYEVSGGALRVESQGRQAFSVFLRQTASSPGRDREVAVAVSSAGQPVYSGRLSG
jgi:hypothetical protein